MKVAPLMKELSKHPDAFRASITHTGQHYDTEMSDVFFHDLDLPRPERFLGAGSGSHAEQTAKVMVAFERECVEERPDLVVVVGDVNSTMACAITAKKLCIPIAHVEAGLRSRDWTMPEETNRVVTDAVSDLLFTPLLNEGYAASFKELMDETDWAAYGTGNYEKCADCMVHCGYEGTAVSDTVRHPLKAARVAFGGIKTDGPMAPEIALDRQRPAD